MLWSASDKMKKRMKLNQNMRKAYFYCVQFSFETDASLI